MLSFILQFLIAASFLGILIMVLRKIPILVQLPVEQSSISIAELKTRVFDLKDKITGIRKERLDIILNNLSQKFLHKVRLWALKVENFSAQRLQKIRETKKTQKERNNNFWDGLKKDGE